MKYLSILLAVTSISGCEAVENFAQDLNNDPRGYSSLMTQIQAYQQSSSYPATSKRPSNSSSPSVGYQGRGTTCHDGSPASMAYDPKTNGYTQPVCTFKGAK